MWQEGSDALPDAQHDGRAALQRPRPTETLNPREKPRSLSAGDRPNDQRAPYPGLNPGRLWDNLTNTQRSQRTPVVTGHPPRRLSPEPAFDPRSRADNPKSLPRARSRRSTPPRTPPRPARAPRHSPPHTHIPPPLPVRCCTTASAPPPPPPALPAGGCSCVRGRRDSSDARLAIRSANTRVPAGYSTTTSSTVGIPTVLFEYQYRP